MAQYLLKMIQPVGIVPDFAELAPVMARLGELQQELANQGSWVFGGGLHQPESATVIRPGDGEPVVTDGPFAEGGEFVGGVTIIDVADLDPTWWWRQVGWLAHRPVVIPGTVRENLQLFGPLPDLDGACRAACFDQVLADLPDGLDTVLGQGGVGLSLGQRQRLGLARVLGSEASVLLLDEPTAHLDGATESAVLAAIRGRADGGATVVVVGHRDAVLAIADTVVDMGVPAHVGV